MPFPVSKSWARSARRAIHDRHAPKGEVATDLSLQQTTAEYARNQFHELFFGVVGHEYLLALQDRYSDKPETREIEPREWRTQLGVDRATISRWRNRAVIAGAHNFFAAQLFILRKPLAELVVPSQDAMILASVLGVHQHVGRLFRLNPSEDFTAPLFLEVVALMTQMSLDEASVYNPYDSALPGQSQDAALERLARTVNDRRRLQSQRAGSATKFSGEPWVLTSQVKVWLDSWGLAYSIVALCYRESWKRAEEIIRGTHDKS